MFNRLFILFIIFSFRGRTSNKKPVKTFKVQKAKFTISLSRNQDIFKNKSICFTSIKHK